MRFYIICPQENVSVSEWAQKMEEAEDLLKSLDLSVVNGCGSMPTLGSMVRAAMSVDVQLLLSATNVLVLDGWLSCAKARAEHNIAQAAKIAIWHEKDMFFEQPQIIELIKAISQVTGLSFYQWTNGSRTRDSFFARMIFCHYCHSMLGLNNTQIAKIINRDRTTVSYSMTAFDGEYEYNKEFKKIADEAFLLVYNSTQNA